MGMVLNPARFASSSNWVGGLNPARPSTISANKFRISYATVGGSPNASASEVEMRASVGGANQCSGGTPLSSSDFSGSYQKAYAFNGNGTTDFWVSAGGLPGAYIGYDFGSAKTVEELYLLPRPGGNECPLTGTVDYWNGSAWVVGWDLHFGPWSNSAKTFRQVATGDRWRVKITAGSGGNGGFRELEMRTSVGGADECTGGEAFSSNWYNTSYYPANAFDNNTGTEWASSNGGGSVGDWIAYDFYTQKEIVEVVVNNRNTVTSTLSFERWNASTRTWDVVWSSGSYNFTAGTPVTFTRPTV